MDGRGEQGSDKLFEKMLSRMERLRHNPYIEHEA